MEPLCLAACRVDLEREEVLHRDGRVERLTPKEAGVLRLLVAHPRRTLSRDQLLGEVWGYRAAVVTRAVDNAVRRLRARVEADPTTPRHVLTVHGEGYVYQPLEPDPGHLVGRGDELRRALEALEHARLLTVVGPGGVGKTALARVILDRRGGAFADLSTLDDPSRLRSAVAGAVGAPWAEVASAVRARGLLVLDHGEHLVDPLRELVTELVATPGVVLVLTSRVPLGLKEEHRLPLAPLGPEAIRTLLERAAIAAGWIPEEDLGPVVARLDGLPLEIELCAPRLGLLGARGLAAQLDRPLDAAGPGPADAPARSRSLRASLAWSWSLLPEPLRGALSALALFRGPFSLAAAEALLGDGALATVEALREVSLLQAREGRFHLLALVRQYAHEVLPPGPGVEARHADWLARTEVPVPREELRVAHSRALTRWPALVIPLLERLGPLYAAVGPAREWLEALDQAEAALPPSAPLALLRFEADLALGRPRDPAALDPALADPLLAPRAWERLGDHHKLGGDLAGARAHYLRGLEISGADALARARLHHALGRLAADRLEHLLARAHLVQAEALFEGLGREPELARVRMHRAMDEGEAGNLDRARAYAEQALESFERRGDHRARGITLSHLALVELEAGRLDDAGANAAEALRLHETVGNRRFVAYSWLLFGTLAGLQDEPTPSATLLQQAVDGFERVGDRRFEGYARARLAVPLARLGRPWREELALAEGLLADAPGAGGGLRVLAALAARLSGEPATPPEEAPRGSFARLAWASWSAAAAG